MKIEICYPNFAKKAITFTIDDGNIKTDRKFLSVVTPGGLRGTFNLCPHTMTALSAEEYRKFYAGHEIANHMAYHPMALDPERSYTVANEPFDPLTADPEKLYPTERAGLYHMRAHRWLYAADRETYLALAEESRVALDRVFGEGSVRSFVYPYYRQKDDEIYHSLADSGKYYGIRKTGATRGADGFCIPTSLPEWSYSADADCLLTAAEAYAACSAEDGLKFFCFGVHSADFENAGKWGDLETFVARFGNREKEYFYATVGEIFDYAESASRLRAENNRICNPGTRPVYLRLDGKETVLRPGENKKAE